MLKSYLISLNGNFSYKSKPDKRVTLESLAVYKLNAYSRVWNKRTPLNKRSPLENLAKRIIVALFFTLYYEVRNKAVAPGKKSKN